MQELTIHTDGGARGNPGPAAVGVHLQCGDWEHHHARYLGTATNNIAEYTAVLDAITLIPDIIGQNGQISSLHFILDSELVVRQLNGQYRVKEPNLQQLHQAVLTQLRALSLPFTFSHVRREQNKVADSLVNQALDRELAN